MFDAERLQSGARLATFGEERGGSHDIAPQALHMLVKSR